MDQVKDVVELPQRFIKEGTQVRPGQTGPYAGDSDSKSDLSVLVSSSTDVSSLIRKVRRSYYPSTWQASATRLMLLDVAFPYLNSGTISYTEYIAICKAVAIGFGVMGFIGYFVKLVSGRAIYHGYVWITSDALVSPDTHSHHQNPRRIVVSIHLFPVLVRIVWVSCSDACGCEHAWSRQW